MNETSERVPLFQVGQIVYVKALSDCFAIQKVINEGSVPLYQLETGKTFFENELELVSQPHQKRISPKEHKEAVNAQVFGYFGDEYENNVDTKEPPRQYLNEGYGNNVSSSESRQVMQQKDNEKLANGISDEFVGIVKMIGLAAFLLVILLVVFSIVRMSDLNHYNSTLGDIYTGRSLGLTIEDLQKECFWREFWEVFRKWGVRLLLTTIIGRYIVKGIKWVINNKSK